MSGRVVPIESIMGQALAVMALWRDEWTRPDIAKFLNDRAVPVTADADWSNPNAPRWTARRVERLEERCLSLGIDPGEMSADSVLSQHMGIGAQSDAWPPLWSEGDAFSSDLPSVDWSDGGFNWTSQELDSAARRAKEILDNSEGAVNAGGFGGSLNWGTGRGAAVNTVSVATLGEGGRSGRCCKWGMGAHHYQRREHQEAG